MIGVPFTHHNRLHLPAGKTDIEVKCKTQTWGLADFQKLGYEQETQVLPAATIDELLGWGRALLRIPTSGRRSGAQRRRR